MSEYVLEILDGDQAGTIVELRGDKLRIGRRPDNDLVMRDEKCSGHHAEVVVEDGRHVLRDLGSTNGTLIDERRITEIALSAGDVFQVGRVKVAFRVAGEAVVATGDDASLAVGRVDVSRLQRSKRRGGSLVLGVLFLLIAGGGAAFLFLSRDGGAGRAVGSKSKPPLQIPGNKLAAGTCDFESDTGWNLKPVIDARGFEPVVERTRAHSGSAAIGALGGKVEGVTARFALARSSEPLAVLASQSVRVSAFVRTAGAAKVALRALFTASGDEVPELRTGLEPVGAADWTELHFDCRVPRGADRLSIELLAFVEADADEVLVDDVAVLAEGEAPTVLASTGGVVALGAGASLRIDASKAPVLLAVEPLVGDGPLADLSRRGLLVMSDVGAELTLSAAERGFTVAFQGAALSGLRLLLPAESAAPRLRAKASGFVLADADFNAEGVTDILVGDSDNRVLFHFQSGVTARGKPHTGAWSIELPDVRDFGVEVLFSAQVLAANAELRDARAARDGGHPGEALAKLDHLVSTVPHDVEMLRQAQSLRSEILGDQERRIDQLLRDGDEAAFFESRSGFNRVLDALAAVERDYAPVGVVRAAATQALGERMREGLIARDARDISERDESLKAMEEAFSKSGDAGLAKLVHDYHERVVPKSEGDK